MSFLQTAVCWLQRADLLYDILRHKQGVSEELGWSCSFATDIVSECEQIIWSCSASDPHLWNGFDGSLVYRGAVKHNCHCPKYYTDGSIKMKWSMIAIMGVIWHPLNGHTQHSRKGIKMSRYWKEKEQLMLTFGLVYSCCPTAIQEQDSMSHKSAWPCPHCDTF